MSRNSTAPAPLGASSAQRSYTYSLVTADRPGVLVRIALVFARRGYNIESLAVSPGSMEGFARMTILSRGDPGNEDQMVKQLAKLIDVVFVTDHRGEKPVEVEIALVKLRCSGEMRKKALATGERFGAKVLDHESDRIILTSQGTSTQISDLIAQLGECNIEEIVRSGKIVMDRGASHFAHLLDSAG
jgi:acetolactate synthase-1/3 small subunit